MKKGKYDGVHLYGRTGRKDYTNSAKSILYMALSKPTQPETGVGTAQPENHNNCPQAEYQQSRYHPSVQNTNRFSLFNQGNF